MPQTVCCRHGTFFNLSGRGFVQRDWEGGVQTLTDTHTHTHIPMSRKTRMAMATMKEVFPYSAMVFTIRDLKILFHLRGSHDKELVNSIIVLAERKKKVAANKGRLVAGWN